MSINLVLSGGGIRGLAHLGLIKLLNECRIPIAQISGVSSGGVMGALTGAGYSPDEILKIIIENKLMYRIRPSFNGGLFNMNKWEKFLLKYIPNNSFESLNIPLTINATDINNCKTVYFSSGDLVLPLLASSAVPGFFEPIVINKIQYVDGGVLNNYPAHPFLNSTSIIIGSHVDPLIEEINLSSAFKILERSVHLAIMEKTEKQKLLIHLTFEPKALSKFSIFDFECAKEIFDIGYTHALSMRSKLEDLVG